MLGEFIPIIAIVAVFGLIMQRNYLRYAEARRLSSGGDSEMVDRVAQLEHEMDGVRSQLAEAQERLDFAERMLTQVRDAQRLPPASPPPPAPDPTRKL